MTEDYITPTDDSTQILGVKALSVDEGVAETVEWLRHSTSLMR
jgi:hypothetical protein